MPFTQKEILRVLEESDSLEQAARILAAQAPASQVPKDVMERTKNLLCALGHQGVILDEGEPPYDIGEWGIREAQELYALLTTPGNADSGEVWAKPTGRKHHDLKTDPAVFRQSLNGFKPWEIRRNDRGFVRGDTVTLHETENTGAEMAEGAPLVYTGRKITGVVGYVLNGPAYGIKPDWCVFSLLPTPPTAQGDKE